MKAFSFVLLGVFAVSLLSTLGCKKEFLLQGIEARVEKNITPEEKNALLSDAENLVATQIDVAEGSFFGKAFGGGSMLNVLGFLKERVNFIISKNAKFEQRLILRSQVLLENKTIQTIATNVGTVSWFVRETLYPRDVHFQFADSMLPLTSSRVGIIQLGEGYSNELPLQYSFPSVFRQSTLVHEARHSDCTGGLKIVELAQIAKGEVPEGLTCGHFHVVCPQGHPLAGAFACDAKPWGAYAIQLLFSAGVSERCLNCTTPQKTTAKMVALDAASRVLVLQDMLEGKLGEPDMTSGGLID